MGLDASVSPYFNLLHFNLLIAPFFPYWAAKHTVSYNKCCNSGIHIKKGYCFYLTVQYIRFSDWVIVSYLQEYYRAFGSAILCTNYNYILSNSTPITGHMAAFSKLTRDGVMLNIFAMHYIFKVKICRHVCTQYRAHTHSRDVVSVTDDCNTTYRGWVQLVI